MDYNSTSCFECPKNPQQLLATKIDMHFYLYISPKTITITAKEVQSEEMQQMDSRNSKIKAYHS